VGTTDAGAGRPRLGPHGDGEFRHPPMLGNRRGFEVTRLAVSLKFYVKSS